MRVFLTGASGYLGGVLARHLASMPEVARITGISRNAPAGPLPAKLKFLPMDIRSPDLAAAIVGHDALIHTACIVLWSASSSVASRDDINLRGIRNVAQAALHAKVPRFIHASSMAAYDPELARGQSNVAEDFPLGKGNSPFYYWNSKALAESALTKVLASSGTTVTMFRPIYLSGPHNRITVQRYRQNAANLLGRNPRRQFIHEADVAAAFLQALRTDMPGAYNIVPDDFIRLSDVWRIVGAKFVPAVPLWVALLVTWLRWRLLGYPVHPSWVRDVLIDFTGSNARLRATGWRPRYGSAEALQAAL
jgi:UDP-glucose 4-epimerase